MADSKSCGCKGIRTCLLCEKSKSYNEKNETEVYKFCKECGNKAWKKSNHESHSKDESKDFIPIDGVFVATDILNGKTENLLVKKIDNIPWVISQSGRRKQDFGPKVNFKKQKCKLGGFRGFPKFAKEILDNCLQCFAILHDFIPVELCHLEYCPERGSAIDPHFDDFWLWGERLVTLNLLSSTYLVLNLPNQYEKEIHILLPPRSLIVLYGEARYKWHHSIKRQHISERRIAMTWREFTPLFLPSGELYESVGKTILKIASQEF